MITVQPRLLVSAGEPAGIGPDICLSLAEQPPAANIAVIGDPSVFAGRARQLGLSHVALPLRDWSDPFPADAEPGVALLPIHFPQAVVPGQPSPENSHALLDSLRTATGLLLADTADALVTAPIQKSAIIDAGISFSGHTEFLAELCGTPQPVMLLVAGALRVALATTHIPLRAVPDAITPALVESVLGVLHDDLSQRYALQQPRIAVCGLNPHAGEGGHLGAEDDASIAPAIAAAQRAGIDAFGPVPADTAFTAAVGHVDAVLAMYHDQGLPVIKHAGFGNAVNVTLGLPIVRTSVDHGTALALAGSGDADPASLLAAVDEAIRLGRLHTASHAA
ncbi:MAG: 4-hydroxythreonine-4-phosphate dehydrogenase PdxA [Pseudomonadota bacterium]